MKGWVREGVGDRTELQHIDPHSYDHQRCVFLVLQGCSAGGPGAHSAGCGLSLTASCHQRVSKLNRGSQRPLLPGGGFFYHILSLTHLISNKQTSFTELYNSSIAPLNLWNGMFDRHQAEITINAVHRSLSSGASVYECTMGFYLVPYRQPCPPTRFLLITAIGMCHFLPVHHFGMACLAGSKDNIQHKEEH